LATTASGNVAKQMTSSWVHSRTLERAYRRQFLTVFGKFEPQNVGHRVDHKKHFLTSQRVFWAIVRHNPSTDDLGEPGKKIKKKRPYISRILPGAPLHPIGTNLGLRVRLVDVINCAKFYRSRLRCSDSMSGQKFDHSHWIAISPLTLCELMFTLWDLTSQKLDYFGLNMHLSDPAISVFNAVQIVCCDCSGSTVETYTYLS